MSRKFAKFILLGSLLFVPLYLSEGASMNYPNIQFCPSESEEDIRRVFEIGNAGYISFGALFDIIKKRGYFFQKEKYAAPVRCEPPFEGRDYTAYTVNAGVSDDGSKLKTYLIVVSADDYITHIEANYLAFHRRLPPN